MKENVYTVANLAMMSKITEDTSVMRKENPSMKNKTISLRVSEEQYGLLKRLSIQNNVSMTTYMLNQSLKTNSGIYNKEFYDMIYSLHHILYELQPYITMNKNAHDVDGLNLYIRELTQEVRRLWQYLK